MPMTRSARSRPQLDTSVLAGGGDMGAMMRARDWSATPLGTVENWPQSLKTAVRIMLTSRQPMFVWWGERLINLYNDPYRAILGGKHPAALGEAAAVVWREIWHEVGPRADSVLRGGEGTYDEALLLLMERNGYPEETYYTFSYSAIPDDNGEPCGILCANTEETARIVGERQVALLRDLANRPLEVRTAEAACEWSAACLDHCDRDMPFAAIYLRDAERNILTRASTASLDAEHPAFPAIIALDTPGFWPVRNALDENVAQMVALADVPGGALPAGAWDRPPMQAIVAPIAGPMGAGVGAIVIAGLSPYRLYDDRYRGFFELVCAQIAASINAARAFEGERKRMEALAALDEAKTRFFSNVSHEFRTPLTLMMGPIEDILRGDHGAISGELRENLDFAHRNSMRLLKLVNTLLDFSRIEAGRTQARFAPVDLAARTAEIASVFRSAIERASMRLTIECDVAEPVYVDADMWEKIVLNLLSNAFKHTFEGEIAVRLKDGGANVVLEVSDTGIGIPEHELPRLFERFHRIEGARGRTFEGSGIGLALVQELVRIHGGSIRAASVLDAGTTFTVSLPRGVTHLPSERIIEADAAVRDGARAAAYVQDALHWGDNRLPESGDGVTPADAHAPGMRSRILLADDNADMREYVRRMLSQWYDVECVGDGMEAIAAVHASPPDLVLTDVMMPRLDGFGLLRELRRNGATHGVPVLMLSARAGEEAKVEGLGAGADDYLVKPFSGRELLARVSALLQLSHARRFALDRESLLREEAETLNDVAKVIGTELELQTLLQKVTEAATRVTGARFGAFFYNVKNEAGESYLLYTLSGAPREAFDRFGMPRNTAVFAPTFNGEGVIRSDDITLDPRYGHNAPRRGMPEGHLPVRSYLAVPVVLRSGEVVGGLFFGHPDVGVFGERAERMGMGIAAQAAIAIDNARLYETARRELREKIAAETALRESERNYRDLVETLPAAVYTCDLEGRLTLYNEAARELWGAAPVIGKTRWGGSVRMHFPDGRNLPLDQCATTIAIEEDRQLNEEAIVERPDGTRRHVLAYPRPLRDAEGRVTGAINILVDITARKDADDALRRSEEMLRLATDVAGVGTWTRNLATGEMHWSSTLEQIYGFEPGELDGREHAFLDLVHPEDRAQVDATARAAIEAKCDYAIEFRFRHKDGGYRWMMGRGGLLPDAQGRSVLLTGTGEDITDRKNAERALAATRDDLALQVAALTRVHGLAMYLGATTELEPALTAILETLAAFHGASSGLLSIHNPVSGMLDAQASIGFDDQAMQVLSAVAPGPMNGACGAAFSAGERVVVTDVEADPRFECYRDVAHRAGFKAVHSTPIATREGEVLGVLSVHLAEARAPTVRERQFADLCALHAASAIEADRAREAFRVSEQRFRVMADAAPAMLWVTDADRRCTFLSRGWYDFTDMTADSGLDDGWLGAVHPDDLARLQERFGAANDRRQSFGIDVRLRHRDAGHRWVSFLGRVRSHGGRFEGFVGSVIDIHDRKLVEDALHDSNRRLDATRRQLETITDTMSAAVARFSRDRRYLWANPNYAARLHKTRDELIGRTVEEILGEPAWQTIEPYVARVLGGEKLEYEALVEFKDVGMRWCHCAYSPTSNESNEPDGWVAVITDISHHKQMEEALREADRRKDEFLAVLAHELRNPLAPIRNSVHVMQMTAGDEKVQAEARDVISRQLTQMVRLVDDLLDVSRISRGKIALRPERIPLRTILDSAIETSRPLLDGASHRLTITAPADRLFVHADLTRLAQVFSNLLNNAAKYTAPGGEIELRVDTSDRRVIVSVKDNGIGIPSEMLGEVFDMFTQVGRSIDRSRGGLGIGLSIAKRLVEMHGGTIEARSEGADRGSEFIVTLPLAREDSDHPTPRGQDGKPATLASRRVLVADDNRDAAESLSLILTMMGNEVRTAHDGLQALEVGMAFRPDIVLLDIGMPNLSGHDVCRRMRETDWGKKATIAALTGWSQDADRRKSREAGFDHHLVKPVEIDAVERLLAGPGDESSNGNGLGTAR